jgi:hypothetical protein
MSAVLLLQAAAEPASVRAEAASAQRVCLLSVLQESKT